MAKVSCDMSISGNFKSNSNNCKCLHYHSAILIVHVGQLAKHSNAHLIFDTNQRGQQSQRTKRVSGPGRKWCGFWSSSLCLLVSWFTVQAKCIMRAL